MTRTLGHGKAEFRRRVGLALVASALCLFIPGCGHDGEASDDEPIVASDEAELASPASTGAPERPDILLFTIDSARADHFSSYGHERNTTPTIDALAARGTRFERAYAPSSWTLPSVASMLSAVLPSEHGLVDIQLTPQAMLQTIVLSEELPSMVEAIRESGYRTVGVTANGHLDGAAGFGRGFDDYECLGFTSLPVVERALAERVDRLAASEGPFFLWVHVFDPHAPYLERRPGFDEFWTPSATRFPEQAELASATEVLEFVRQDPSGARLDYLRAAYDSEIRATDRLLHGLLERLAGRRLAVVVSSDHGEEFLEHGGVWHGRTLFEESIRVPLVVALPEQGPTQRVIDQPVSLIDVLPTLVELVGAELPEGVSGHSLLPALRGHPLRRPPVIAELAATPLIPAQVAPIRSAAIVDGRHKYIEHTHGASSPTLFDLSRDPGESYNQAEVQPDVTRSMRRELRSRLAEASARQPVLRSLIVPPPTQEQLRALGYAE